MCRNVFEIFKGLDECLLNGSYVIVIGLVDGCIFYDSFYNCIYFIGSLRNDVMYEYFYDFMNCLQVFFCFGWMNFNKIIRDLISERVVQLSVVLKNVVEVMKYENFDVYFFDCFLEEVFRVSYSVV